MFEWAVVILLVFILFKPAGRINSREADILSALERIEDLLRTGRSSTEEITAILSSIESNASDINIRLMPENPPY